MRKIKGIIDRFEGQYAVVELSDGKIIDIDRAQLPAEAEEGMVIDIFSSITINLDETKRRKEEIEKLTEDLWDE